jgi:uncharacterized membrane protein (UPF0182 family)
MEETLEASIERIFRGGTAVGTESPPAAEPETAAAEGEGSVQTPSLIRQARESYDRAIQAQRQGDWAQYGAELKKLGAILQELDKARKVSAEPRRQVP